MEASPRINTCHYVVSGLVQGVSFRYYTRLEAEKLGIRGTVANLGNGDVEVFAQGDAESLMRFEAFLSRGSGSARVSGVMKRELPAEFVFSDFRIVFKASVQGDTV